MVTQVGKVEGLRIMDRAEVLGAATMAPFMLAGGLFSSGAALGLFLMIRRALWLHSTGPICGDHAAGLHCAGCYGAALLMMAGVALAAGLTPASRER
jgi:hypothetical protein